MCSELKQCMLQMCYAHLFPFMSVLIYHKLSSCPLAHQMNDSLYFGVPPVGILAIAHWLNVLFYKSTTTSTSRTTFAAVLYLTMFTAIFHTLVNITFWHDGVCGKVEHGYFIHVKCCNCAYFDYQLNTMTVFIINNIHELSLWYKNIITKTHALILWKMTTVAF